MRCLLVTLWPVVLSGLAACGRPAAAARGEDTLLLEVGGEQGSLRQALVAAGVPLAPRAASITEPMPLPEPREHVPPDAPPVPAVTPPDHILVELGRGETLIHLAKRHLGDGNRFRDILTANGWTENDARRLPAGQLVRVPLRPAAAPSGQ